MLHISRDFISLPSIPGPRAGMYFNAIFLRTVLQYTIIGQTSFDLDGSSFTLSTGTNGTISSALGFTNRLTPGNGYTVSLSDINRIIVIRSTINPMINSGLWRVVGIDTINNQFILGLRGNPPVTESGLTWRLYVAENSFTFTSSNNSNTTEYRGRTSGSTTSRIIMQSPHSIGYQVRLTYEAPADISSTGNVSNSATVAPGFGGDSIGDFPIGGYHLHPGIYANTAPPSGPYKGLLPSCSPSTSSGIWRAYIWGEDTTGTVVMCFRAVDVVANTWLAYGLPENEEYPNSELAVHQLFSYGPNSPNSGQVGVLNWSSGFLQSVAMGGCAYGYSGQPVSCVISPYQYSTGQQLAVNQGPRFSSVAGDNPFLGQTELLTVDLLAGTWDAMNFAGQDPSLILEPRRLGRFPIARLGRANFGNWSTTTDSQQSWLHTLNGVYLPWYGSILP